MPVRHTYLLHWLRYCLRAQLVLDLLLLLQVLAKVRQLRNGGLLRLPGQLLGDGRNGAGHLRRLLVCLLVSDASPGGRFGMGMRPGAAGAVGTGPGSSSSMTMTAP